MIQRINGEMDVQMGGGKKEERTEKGRQTEAIQGFSSHSKFILYKAMHKSSLQKAMRGTLGGSVG